MKFRGHETFFIRKGWLGKGVKCVNKAPNLFVDKNKNPMDVLGIGSNMVKALRYWLQATGLTVEPDKGKKDQSFTNLGKIIKEKDPYIEEIGTLQLLHYKLINNFELATSWFCFFNKFNMQEFTKDDFSRFMRKYIAENNGDEVADRSLNDDFICLINSYLPRYKNNSEKNISPENNIDCPFGELGLIDIVIKGKTYKKSSPSIEDINPYIALAIIIEQAKGAKQVRLNDLLIGESGIGKTFNLDTVSLLELLCKVEKTNSISIIRTAGLDCININSDLSFEQCVDKYYETISSFY